MLMRSGSHVFASWWLRAFVCLAVVPCAHAAERGIPWSSGWVFHRGEVLHGEAIVPPNGVTWRTVEIPHDWSIEDLGNGDLLPEIEAVTGDWRFHAGDEPGWKEPACADRDWTVHRLPAGWKALRGEAPENSFGWYRRTLPAQPALAGQAVIIRLGKIDDADETWLNGVRIGGTGTFPPAYTSAWDKQRNYPVPAGLFKGDGSDVLAVRMFNGGGDGGIYAAVLPRQAVGPFDTVASEGGPSTAYTVAGIGWYRRTFDRDPAWDGKRIELRFAGVYRNATVWLNGRQLAFHAYGFTPFTVDLTPALQATGNVLAVQVANTGRNSRWYTGSGIFRPVELAVVGDVGIPASGIAVTTTELEAQDATLRIAVTVVNHRTVTVAPLVTVRIQGPEGGEVAHAVVPGAAIAAAEKRVVEVPLTISGVKRWDLATPYLYSATADIAVDGVVTDEDATTFGIRAIEIDAAHGFRLNGKPLKLRGGCIHADNGPLGGVSIARAEERRVELLKARGFNAVRLAHNPPAPAFLAACDRLGMLVLDEAFDMWREGKNDQDYHLDFPTYWQDDIDAMVVRDRNHPAIFAWSIGNEIPERFAPRGLVTAKALIGRVKANDPTRPVTQALNGGWDEQTEGAVCGALDLVGYNYQLQRYASDGKKNPQRVIFASESFPLYADEHWYGVLDHPHVIGDFVWTAIDYLGEAGCGFVSPKSGIFYELQPFPMYTGNCGDLDLCGFQRPQSLYRDVLWDLAPGAIVVERPRPTGVGSHPNPWAWPDVEASWNWAGHEGEPLAVTVYAKAERVELFLGAQRIGEAPAGRAQHHRATFTVPYAAGTLRAVIHQGGGQSEVTLTSTGPAAAVRLVADRAQITARGDDLAYVGIEIVDAEGRVVPDAVVPVTLAVGGVGRLLATGNGSSSDPASFSAPLRRTYRGRALAICRALTAGNLTLTATAPGLTGATTVVEVVK
jgi:beta-galactosidase